MNIVQTGGLGNTGTHYWDGYQWIPNSQQIVSNDGRFVWDGTQWIPTQSQQISQDGMWVWNGVQWIPNQNVQTYQQPQQFSQPQQYFQPQTTFIHQPIKRGGSSTGLVLGIIAAVLIVGILIIAGISFAVINAFGFSNDNTPEFGFRHDVDYRLYEDLGSNDGIYSAGINYPDFSSTVAIIGEDGKGDASYGSGVVISEYWVLTAAHVIDESLTSRTYVFDGNDYEDSSANRYSVSKIFIHPGWEVDSDLMEEGMDIALLRLEDPIDQSAVEISPWHDGDSKELDIGSLVFTAGFGAYDRQYSECTDFCLTDGSGDYSQRRAWANTLDREVVGIRSSDSFQNDNIWLGGFISYDFDSPDGKDNTLASGNTSTFAQGDYSYVGSGDSSPNPLDLEGTSVSGDSGGPTYAYLDGEWKVIGLTSHGSLAANYGDVAVNTHVGVHTSWICSKSNNMQPIIGC